MTIFIYKFIYQKHCINRSVFSFFKHINTQNCFTATMLLEKWSMNGSSSSSIHVNLC